jgi:hypothetical protein
VINLTGVKEGRVVEKLESPRKSPTKESKRKHDIMATTSPVKSPRLTKAAEKVVDAVKKKTTKKSK